MSKIKINYILNNIMSKNFNPEEIKTDFEKEEIILGIDEAGRGNIRSNGICMCILVK